MLVPRKNAEAVEHAIERRLVQTMVSGGVRPFHRIGPVRKANPAGTGLFLVKPAMADGTVEVPTRLDIAKAVRAKKVRASAEGRISERKGPAKVIPMVATGPRDNQEISLGLMAALGPMLWLGHAALVWLKVI